MRQYASALALLMTIMMIAGCGGSKGVPSPGSSNTGAGSAKSYAELRWGMPVFPGAIDFNKTPFGQATTIESLAVQSLMEFEPNGKVKLGLASAVEQPNATTYVFHLKSARFSDGKPMTAADVVFSLDRNIDGAEAWTKSFWADVASIAERNVSTVVVKLKRPSAIFEDVVAFSGAVIEKAAAEKAGEKALGTPGHMLIGTGPWKIDGYKPELSAQLSRNPYWTGPRQPARSITVEFFKTEAAMALALRSGAIYGATEYVAPRLFANIPGTQQLNASAASIMLAVANTKQAPFNDIHVRRALAYATHVKGMISALYPKGEATEAPTLIPTSLFTGLGSHNEVNEMFATLPKYEFDLEKARQELAKSAYPHGFSTPIEVAQSNDSGILAAQILASDLAKIGIKATVQELTPGQETAWTTGKIRLGIVGTGTLYPDPEGIMSSRLVPSQIYPGGGQNMANYRNAEVDKLLTESVETLNKPKRLQMIGKLLGIVNGEVPYWPLFSPSTVGVLSKKYVLPGFSYWTMFWTPWAMNLKLALS